MSVTFIIIMDFFFVLFCFLDFYWIYGAVNGPVPFCIPYIMFIF